MIAKIIRPTSAFILLKEENDIKPNLMRNQTAVRKSIRAKKAKRRNSLQTLKRLFWPKKGEVSKKIEVSKKVELILSPKQKEIKFRRRSSMQSIEFWEVD
jgi:hypothetical protein